MKHLFLFTIGPVQSFISQARKTQDLYAGSDLLSRLIETAIEKFKDTDGFESLIFPNTDYETKKDFNEEEPETNRSFPNRFLGTIWVEDEDKLNTIGNEVEKAVLEKIKCLGEEVINTLSIQQHTHFVEQLDKHFTFHWLYQPIEEDDYKSAYETIEKNLAGIKNIRSFEQYSYKDKGVKCSLSGECNALYFNESINRNEVITKFNKPVFIDKHHFKKQEGLSAIGLVKRFYDQTDEDIDSFPSTAEIALKDALEQRDQNADEQYKTLFKGKDLFDDELYYPENLNKEYFDKNGLNQVYELTPFEHLEEKRSAIFGNLSLPKYYAFIIFDGDKMGDWLRGENTTEEVDETFHQDLSEWLANYADSVQEYFKKNSRIGSIVYTGGDDFVGFINLHHLYTTLQYLRLAFQEEISNPLVKKYTPNGDVQELTFSAGITIAHYRDPLRMVVEKARSMEQKAKDVGRDAFAISTIKGSGEIEECVFSWSLTCKDNTWQSDSIQHFMCISNYLSRDEVSPRFIQNLADEFYNTFDEVKKASDEAHILKSEIKRLIKRSTSNLPEEDTQALIDSTIQLLEYSLKQDCNSNTKSYDVQNFLYSLKTIEFIRKQLLCKQ